jgi:hypothetical protein
MAKSASVLLLTVLAVAMSLGVFAATPVPEVVESISKFDSWIKDNLELLKEVKEKADELKDRVEVAIEKFSDKGPQAPPIVYLKVTDIKVHGVSKGIAGDAILITTIPLSFLDTAAFNVLKQEFTTAKPVNKFGLLCNDKELSSVTLVMTIEGTDTTLERRWRKHTDESYCLGILPVPSE